MSVLSLYLIRHGESEMNRDEKRGLIGGRCSPSPLTLLGLEEARKLGLYFAKKGKKFDYVFSSTALRAKTTAQLSVAEIGYSESDIILRSDLEEMDIGDWTLKPILEIFGPGKVEKFDFETKPPNGESFHEVVKRVGRFVEESILEQIHRVEMSKPEPKQKITIAVYAHGMVLKAFFKYLTEYQTSQLFSFPIKNTAVMHFLYQKRGPQYVWALNQFNSTTHLEMDLFKPNL